MADTLAAIVRDANADPMAYAFRNGPRAEFLARGLAGQSGPQAQQARFLVAQERLLAGQTRPAIAELERIVDSLGASPSARRPEAKPLFDLLALAYLRLGEQENCNLNPSASVCILPLDGAARHRNEEGARKAIAAYERLLAQFPTDNGSRWLLNLSYMAVGEYPRRVPPQWLIPGLDRRETAAFPRFHNVAPVVGVGVRGLSGAAVVEDYNRDGLLDVFTTSRGLADPPHLLMADGAGGFADRTAAAGLAKIVGGLNATHADFDNDGYSDILVLRGAWLGAAGRQPMSLLRNRGDGTFEDVTYAAGLGSRKPRHAAAWADYDLDGNVDVFVGAESAAGFGGASFPSELFHNNGDGTFTEVSAATGVMVDAFVKGAAWGDVNGDGRPDLYVSTLYGPNRLFVNQGGARGAWRFAEAPAAGGASAPQMSFATWFWDVNDDGRDDLLALSYDIRNGTALHDAVALEYLGEAPVVQVNSGPAPVEPARVYLGNGDGTFRDATAAYGLAGRALFAMGANFGDLDNDGRLDFYVGTGNPDLRSIIPNRMFRQAAGGRFEEVTRDGGFAHLQKGHGAAFADFDRDGDEDVFMEMGGAYEGDIASSVLFENPGAPGTHWLTLWLEGTTANRGAIGARVTVEAVNRGGTHRWLHRTVGTGGSFGSSPLQVHVGLGEANIGAVIVRWPDARQSTDTLRGLATDRAYHVVQGRPPEVLPWRAVPFRRTPDPAEAHPHTP